MRRAREIIGRIWPEMLFVAAVTLAVIVSGCGASARQSTLQHTMVAMDTAETAFLSFDGAHQLDIVSAAASNADATKKLADYRSERDKVAKAMIGAYRAIAAAATLDDDHSLAGAIAAGALVLQELTALGVKL